MTFETDLWDSLTGDVVLAALIGTRLYRDRREQKPTPPYVRQYQVRNRLSQGLGGSIQVERPVFVFQIFSQDEGEAMSVRDAMRAAMLTISYPVVFEDDTSDADAISGLFRRDMTVRMAHG